MSEREKILARAREAMKVPARGPGTHGNVPSPASAQSIAAGARQWLPKVGDSFAEQLELFQTNAVELKADLQMLAGREELKAALAKLSARENWTQIASHRGELTVFVGDSLGLPVCWTDGGYEAGELEACDAGISECDALIAQTGSVLVTNRSAGGRALSVLPPHHVVLARRDQLVADLPAAFELLKRKYGGNYPGMISFITGPSRTGDIERILVLGAHGPKRLTIFLI